MKRLFRGLRGQEPKKNYDAVVIGAGVGGLVAANLLARDGLRVLLVEQHYMVGGYCSTFRRAGFTFDASTHFYPLLGNPTTLPGKLLVDLGVRTEWVKMDPVDTFHFPDGSSFHVPADLETYRARLEADFPAEKESLETFFEEVREAYLLGLLCYFRNRSSDRLGQYRDLTVSQALDRRFKDEKLKLLLTADCPHWGSPPGRTSFVFDSMLRLSYFLGNYYPVGGSQAFADELARCFEERGGEVLMSSRAKRILVTEGVVSGVEVETTRGPLRGQRTIEAPAVVSNADLLATWQHLLAPEDFPEEKRAELQGLQEMRPTFPCFLSHIGLRGVDPSVLEEAQGYYWAGWDPDRVGTDALVCKVFVPTLYDSSLAPEGCQIVILQKVQELDYRSISDWPGHKQDVEDFVTAHLERVIPGIRDHIVVQLSASAATARRFTWNESGAMLGWEMSPEQLGEARPGVVGPVPGLFQVGHWVRPGGGITPVIISAMQAAESVSRAGEESKASETVASETVASETVASETVASETVASEAVPSKAAAPKTVVSKREKSKTACSETLSPKTVSRASR